MGTKVLGCVGEKWATETKQGKRWNTQDKKDVMTSYIINQTSERDTVSEMWSARKPTINVTEQGLLKNEKKMKMCDF